MMIPDATSSFDAPRRIGSGSYRLFVTHVSEPLIRRGLISGEGGSNETLAYGFFSGSVLFAADSGSSVVTYFEQHSQVRSRG